MKYAIEQLRSRIWGTRKRYNKEICGLSLDQQIRFEHAFGWEIGRKSTEEWVTVAESLVKNFNVIPNPKWLHDNGYRGLYYCIRRHPTAFKHLPNSKKTTLPFIKARLLVRKRRFTNKESFTMWEERPTNIPSAPSQVYSKDWLGWNDFLGTPRRTQPKTLAKWVLIAEGIAKKNGGELPINLQRKGQPVLARIVRHNPKVFAHIKQAKRNTSHSLVAYAVRLAEDNDGVLPNPRRHAVLRHRRLFEKMFKRVGGYHGKWILKRRAK